MEEMKAAIFDLDGVIVDTVPLHFKAWKRIFSEYGIEFTFDDYKKKVDGIPRIDGAKAILKDLDEEKLRQVCERKQRYFLENVSKDKIKTYNSTVNLIKELKACGIKVAVISSSRNLKMILRKVKLDKIMDAIISGDDIKKGKPDPEVFLTAADGLGIEPNECIVFEDAVLGVEAAKRARMVCVGIDRYNNPSRLAKADIVVSDLAEVDFRRLKELFKK